MNIALHDLFTTDIGIFSLITLGCILSMACYIGLFVRRHVLAEEAEHSTDGRPRQGR